MTENRAANWRKDGLALLSLGGLVALFLWRLALTDLIIGRGDLFFYFYPYRDFAAAAARAVRVPLWNPYLFMGAPFLANSQAGFFYPLNLALAWLPVERMVNASLVIHTALAAMGAYVWGRGGLALSRPAAWLCGVCYGLGGYYLAQVEHLNQVQVLAWLPWLLRAASGKWQAARGIYRVAGLAAIVGVQFLAGHTQSVFICLVGLAGYVGLPLAWDVLRRRVSWRGLVRPGVFLVGATLLGAALAAVQLVPTWELTQLSVRSGGLPYKEAVSFSLRPGLLGRALLPGWGATLFPEFVAYVGVTGLALAVVGGAAAGFDSFRARNGRRGALVLAGLGLFLALGGFNPLYFLLVKFGPGFGLFRAPARWLALYAVGVAGLAGMGLDRLVAGADAPTLRRWRVSWLVVGAGLAFLIVGSHLLGSDAEPDLAPPLNLWSVLGWLAAALIFGSALCLHASRITLVAFVICELFAASQFLPLQRATAPGALTSLRPAVAHLLAAAADESPPARFLSISDILFDPGDKPEIEAALGSQLSNDAVYDYLIATKQKEVLIPNLPLYYRLPAMDGYDGGVLPLRRYVTLERLYMPAEQVAMDGRLRENLETIPDGRWLSLFNARYVVTDKLGDAWLDGVLYDLQMGAHLSASQEAVVGYAPPLAATALGVVYQADGAPADTVLARLEVTFESGVQTLVLRADATATGDRVARLSWGRADTPTSVRVSGAWQEGEVFIRGLSLIDERTDVFQSLVLSDRGRFRLAHSGDVKIYENLDVLPRAFFVSQAITVLDDAAALTVMRDPAFDPATTAVLIGKRDAPIPNSQFPIPNSQLPIPNFVRYEPERVIVDVVAPADGWLVLTDAWFPGWEVQVDGQAAVVERADVLFRAVAVSAGAHRVEWVYRPASFRWGAVVSLGGLVMLFALIGRRAWWIGIMR
jgi:hypothetical protein